jgi:hypothetical protein
MHPDPLFEYEKKHIHHTRPSIVNLILKGAKLLIVYLLLSGTIFSIFLGILNFGAYSARVLDWIDPEHLLELQQDLTSAIARSSMEVHADTLQPSTQMIETRDVIADKIAQIDPALVYSRTYSPDNLLSNINRTSSPTTFDLAPYENRIIIPKIGKNIPLVDVHHGA